MSVLELFSIGIGPSSSHTVGPMRAAKRFAESLADATHIEVDLLGSLGSTGPGHGTPDAVRAGLRGLEPETCDPADVHGNLSPVLLLGRHPVTVDISLLPRTRHPDHPNALRLRADGVEQTYLSVGGGTIVEPGAQIRDEAREVPHPYDSAEQLLKICTAQGCDIATVVRRNELARCSAGELETGLARRWAAMRACVLNGLKADGVLPGGLHTPRRARALAEALEGTDSAEWLQVYAIAVNEENAAGGRVVTAPTNGAAGVIPAVLFQHLVGLRDTAATVETFLLTAAAIGDLVARNASIAGADVGCQGEVGSAAAMAAGGLCAVLGGSPAMVENAAEIALEHHLG